MQTPPWVAFAIGRAVGPAVVRNRLRRRLRAVLATRQRSTRCHRAATDRRPAERGRTTIDQRRTGVRSCSIGWSVPLPCDDASAVMAAGGDRRYQRAFEGRPVSVPVHPVVFVATPTRRSKCTAPPVVLADGPPLRPLPTVRPVRVRPCTRRHPRQKALTPMIAGLFEPACGTARLVLQLHPQLHPGDLADRVGRHDHHRRRWC